MTAVLITAALLRMAHACAPDVPPETLLPVAAWESHLNPLSIHDNTAGEDVPARSVESAKATAARLIARGHDLDVGFMQINWRWNSNKLPSLAVAFDPCASMRVAQAVLVNCSTSETDLSRDQVALRGTLSCYNAGNRHSGMGAAYAEHIFDTARYVIPAIRLATGDEPPDDASAAINRDGDGPVDAMPRHPAPSPLSLPLPPDEAPDGASRAQ